MDAVGSKMEPTCTGLAVALILVCGFSFSAREFIGVKPVLQAMVLAERVYECANGQHVIAGTFNRIGMSRQPLVQDVETGDGQQITTVMGGVQPGSPFVYISLTDVVDNTELSLQFVNLSRNRVLLSTQMQVKCSDRLATVEIKAGLPELRVTEPGVYSLELVWEHEVIGSHRIVAEYLDSPTGET